MIVQAGQNTPCYDADFDPFGGEHVAVNTCPQNYKFTGKERDAETGLDDFEARYYSSGFGRFQSADWSAIPAPVPYADLGNPQTLNLYAYVKNNPMNFSDPTGHYFCCLHIQSGDQHQSSSGHPTDAWGNAVEGWFVTVNGEATFFRDPDIAAAFRSANAVPVPAQQTAQNQQSNRQPDGSYKATPAQLAKIQEAADKKQTIGNGECVTACERFTGVPGPTSSWKGGKPASELTDKDKGTAIATFIKGPDGEWHYLPDSGGHRNSGTFMGTSTNGTFWMADQWPQGKPVSIWNVGSSVGSNPNNASMNPASYRVIIVPKP